MCKIQRCSDGFWGAETLFSLCVEPLMQRAQRGEFQSGYRSSPGIKAWQNVHEIYSVHGISHLDGARDVHASGVGFLWSPDRSPGQMWRRAAPHARCSIFNIPGLLQPEFSKCFETQVLGSPLTPRCRYISDASISGEASSGSLQVIVLRWSGRFLHISLQRIGKEMYR